MVGDDGVGWAAGVGGGAMIIIGFHHPTDSASIVQLFKAR